MIQFHHPHLNLLASTHNPHKISEFREILGDRFTVIGLGEIGFDEDIPETGTTLEENALIKVRYIKDKVADLNCFADDTGLEVKALGGEPGVYSARWAGENCSPKDNVRKLLKLMEGKTDRRARFRTVIALIIDGEEHIFSGEVNGTIATAPAGKEGFGYDPVFIPDGWNKTFAQASPYEKNSVSHRGRALKKMIDFLNDNY